ncbi:hypothetical protein [Sulfurimonas sp.]|uniref:hypothetical protein n=1 Tax=Sulfurimonas sp. TaxID=2022749 RepID=UPI0025D20423|nr:hypothetical protein [Sulfurimonas sp.]
MGAYLYYTTNSNPEDVQNYLLEINQLNMKLIDELDEQGIFITCSKDDSFNKYATGDIKTSYGSVSAKFEEAGYAESDLLEMWTMIFEQLNERFEMKYFANSCAFSEKEHYFSLEQMKRITNNGKLLSGKTSKSDRARELYGKYLKLFSEPEDEIFNIAIVKDKDTVLVDGIWREVEFIGYCEKYRLKHFKDQVNGYIDELVDKIKGHRKYVPKIRYGGAVSDIEAYIVDNGTLIYLETVGTENMVKSVTSVLMQGRVIMNDITVDASFGLFSINKAGNKRKMTSLDDGLAHAILYHSPSISDTDFSVLIGRDKNELLTSFSAWLEKSQPLPYPKELTEEIYAKLQNNEKLEELTSLNIEAIKVDLSVLEEECYDLQEIILEVCKEHNLIDANAKPLKEDAPLPKSPYLKPSQVQKIFSTLKSMPKTYALNGVEIKPIGLKLFSPNMTLYITEADIGDEGNEFNNMHTQCYGYIENESDPQMSEWGYIDVPYYLELGIKVGKIGNVDMIGGFEQDLHFDDMHITSSGTILDTNEIKEVA